MTSRNLVTVPSTSTVAEALSKMRTTGIHQVPVMTGKRYAGMLSYREVLRRRSIRSNSKVESFMIRTAKLSPKTEVHSAIRLLRDSGLAALPVVDAGKLIGILSRTDILKNFSSIIGEKELKTIEIMSADPVVIIEDDLVDKALEKFRNLDESEMPVVSRDGKLLGMLRVDQISSGKLLDRNERLDTLASGEEPDKLKINTSSVMLKHVMVEPQTPVEDCASIMVRNQLRVLPVSDSNGKVIGVIGASDIINLVTTGANQKGILIQVSGLDPWDDELYDILFYNASKFVSRLPKLTGMKNGNFDVHVAKYHSEGRTKYSLRTRLMVGSLNMSINDYDWNFGKCIDKIIESYENRLSRRREK